MKRRFLLVCGAGASVAACNVISGAYVFEPGDAPLDRVPADRPDAGGGGRDSGRLEADAAQNDGGDGGELADAKRVFVTNGYWYVADVGGIPGADTHCQDAATSAGLGSGPWRAWLSTQAGNARDRIEHRGAYVLVGGGLVAGSWEELTSGTLQQPILITERGTPITGSILDSAVWTGTSPDGTRATTKPEESCQDFTSPGGATGLVGSCFKNADGQWTKFNAQSCSLWPAHLYCFEL